MKISSQDEYGLRLMLRLANTSSEEGLSIPQLSEEEGLSEAYVAKLTRILRMSGLISSTRGHKGGYQLARPADKIYVDEVLKAISGSLFDEDFCSNHTGGFRFCTHSVDCSVRSLWKVVQATLDKLLSQITLADLQGDEMGSVKMLNSLVEKALED